MKEDRKTKSSISESFAEINPELARLWLHVPSDWRRPGASAAYDIYWKDDLDFGQILPRPTPNQIADFYEADDYYTHRATAKHATTGSDLFWRILVHLAWRVDQSVEPDVDWWRTTLGAKPRRILEIGCGNGENLKLIQGLGHEVEGVEPDPHARTVALEAGLSVHAGTGELLPSEMTGKTYDLIVFMHVLEHCLDPVAAIQNARNLLAPNGCVVVEVPNNSCRGAKVFGNEWHWIDAPRHLNFFTEKSLTTLLQSQGLLVQESVYRGYTRQFLPSWAETQRLISQRFGQNKPHKWRSYLKYFLQTLKSPASRKYDSIRVTAFRSEERYLHR